MNVNTEKLITGMIKILEAEKLSGKDPVYPIKDFELGLIERGLTKMQAKQTTEKMISSGRLAWVIFSNKFTLTGQ